MSKKKDKAEPTEPGATTCREMLAISRALADPRRVEVFRKIASCHAVSCTDMREGLTIKPATLSHHMKQLEAAGLIDTVRDGKFVRASVRRKTWKSYLTYLKAFAA